MTRTISRVSSLLLLLSGQAAPAPDNSSNPRAEFQSFRIIAERNIFNPNRSNRPARSTRRENDSERRAKIETFALVGTMSYEKGRYAFFDGSTSDYRKVLQTSETIAGYTVAEVAPDHVKLEITNQPPIELRIGMQMRKRDDEDWRLSNNPGGEPMETRRSSSSQGEKTEADSSASPSSSGDNSDVLKRLTERRNQELQNEKP